MTVNEGDEPFQWDVLVPRIVHPLKVAIIETIQRLERPLSAVELARMFDIERVTGSLVSYHIAKLVELGALVKVDSRPVRGTFEHFYFFPRQNGSDPTPYG